MNMNDTNTWTLSLQNFSLPTPIPRDMHPFVQTISYDVDKNTMSAACTNPDSVVNTTLAKSCMWGYFIRNNGLSFVFNDTRTYTETKFQTVDKQWSYDDDAPSFELHKLRLNGEFGEVIIQTAVTKRNHCQLLKICLGSKIPNLGMLAPLGLALWAQDRYASYCSIPRLYG